MQLLIDIQEIRNSHLEYLHDDKMKLLSDLGNHGEEGQKLEGN